MHCLVDESHVTTFTILSLFLSDTMLTWCILLNKVQFNQLTTKLNMKGAEANSSFLPQAGRDLFDMGRYAAIVMHVICNTYL